MSIKEYTDNTKHSKIGASSMYRWSACPGSVQMSEMAETPSSSIHAITGTIAHEVAAYYLTKGFYPLPDEYGLTMSELEVMVETGVKHYVEYIERLHDREPHNTFHIEHSFDMDMVYPGAFGTADFVSYNPETKYLKVVDYKHGKGLVVEVENNSQLLYYALGAVSTLDYPFRVVELVVVQPRAFHSKGPIRNWVIGVEELLEFEHEMKTAAKRTEAKDPYFKAGEHCFFCSAIEICPKSEEAKAAKRNKVMMPHFKSDPKDDFKPVKRVD